MTSLRSEEGIWLFYFARKGFVRDTPRRFITTKGNTMYKKFIIIILSALIVSTNCYAGASETKFLGKSIGVLVCKLVEVVFIDPTPSNPMKDGTGANCRIGQKGTVWFLAGNFLAENNSPVERSCTIPSGKYILFPIANSIWIQTPFDDRSLTEIDYRRIANELLPQTIGGELEATLDGNPIIYNPKTPIIQSQSPVFTAKFPADNVFGVDASYLTGYPIVSDGIG